MCLFKSPEAPQAQITPPPATPAPAANPMAPAAPVAASASGDDTVGNNSSSASALTAARGRASLRIDRTQPNTGSSGSGLNIPA